MISRPIVSATLAGALLGAPAQGLLVGVVLELIALETLPVGASRYPEWGSASVVAGALYVGSHGDSAGALMVAVLGGLVAAWIGGLSMVWLRRRNATLAHQRRAGLDAGSGGTVLRVQLLGIASDFARALLLTGVAYAVLAPVERALANQWTLDPLWSRSALVAVAASVALGASWKLFHLVAGTRWLFLGGLAIGFGLLALGVSA
jgi:mannose/fructose/N-acetylgalactosamine-specific phosphotransferase system component IIC